LSIPAFATAIEPQPKVVYTVDLTDTKNGHDVIDTVLVEYARGTAPHFSKIGTMGASGETIFSSDYFGQTRAGIVGLDSPALVPSRPAAAALSADDKWHLVFAMDIAAARVATGSLISQLYPPAHENPTIDALQSWYQTDDPDALALLQTFFGTDANRALFSVPGPFTVVEFTPGTPIGGGRSGVPEPGTLALAGFGAIAIWAVRRRVSA